MKVTATISTRNRYFTTLPLCLTAIANQTKAPDELIIYDDGEHKDIRNEPIYQNIFSHLSKRKIFWHVEFGSGEGQVKNHQRALLEAEHELIWRLDDDNVPEANVLEVLFGEMGKQTGAIGGLVMNPQIDLHPNKVASSKIEDVYLGINEQWYPHEKTSIKAVDHLYSSFLFRKEAAQHGYNLQLSRVGHREETIFTYEMKRKGWNVAVTPHCVTWHYNFPAGGIRDATRDEMWQHDENIFKELYKSWGVRQTQYCHIVLNNGLGDHYMFKTLMPEILKKYKGNKILLATCFPELFTEYEGVYHLTIADAVLCYGEYINDFDIYKWMVDNNWKGHLIDAYRKLYKL